jgi:hypothetical protein|tara:strand:+ start:395 stop:577 length:183 start_codon:yes stop_codon:yes gene_type:complete
MEKPLETILNSLEEEEIQKILNGLDLLDEYYSTEMAYDEVLDTRSLKDTIRKHIPKHLIN